MNAADFTVEVRVLGTMACYDGTLDTWKQAASRAWPLAPTETTEQLLFTLAPVDAQAKSRQGPVLQPYTQAELLHAVGTLPGRQRRSPRRGTRMPSRDPG